MPGRPAAELEKLKPGMEALCPSWFEYACGLGRP